MRVAAVVVNWNGGEENLECLRSLIDSGLEPGWIWFVDNASSDGSLELVRRTFPGLVFLENDTNLGYGHGNNGAIVQALERGAEATLLVNNDAVLEPGALKLLVAALEEDESLGIVGPRVLYKGDPHTLWAAGGRLTFRENLSKLIGQNAPDGPAWRKSFPVDYVVGCAMLVRRSVFEEIGLIDGSFFAYHEDVDFCLRAGYSGFGVRCIGEAAALHTSSAATGGGYNPRKKYMIGVNTIWFLRRHGTWTRWLRFFVFDILSLPFAFVLGLFRGRGRAVLAKAKGMFDGARGRRVTEDRLHPGASRLW